MTAVSTGHACPLATTSWRNATALAVHDDRAKRAFEGTRAVLARQSPQFVLQHSKGGIAGTRYWVLTVHPLNHAAGGAVVTHAEITERKRAELEAQAARAELAHMSRVSTMGELTSSLAHELNQPLAAIIANAQAARRLIAQPRIGSADELRPGARATLSTTGCGPGP